MGIFGKPIEAVTKADLGRLIDDEIEEGQLIDFKQDVPGGEKGGRNPWNHETGKLERSGSNEILGMLVSFANAEGGVLVLGMKETEESPPRAAAITPILGVVEPSFPLVIGRPTYAAGRVVVAIAFFDGVSQDRAYERHGARCGAFAAADNRAAARLGLHVNSGLAGRDVANEGPQVRGGEILDGPIAEQRHDVSLDTAGVQKKRRSLLRQSVAFGYQAFPTPLQVLPAQIGDRHSLAFGDL